VLKYKSSKKSKKMAIFDPKIIFLSPDWDNQEGLGAVAQVVCCTKHAYAISKNLSHLGQVLGSCRATKLKKSNFWLLRKSEKSRFSQVTKVDRSL